MTNFDPISALNYGVIGLGFLLALLSFWLLSKAQPTMYVPIYVFMVFSMLVIILGLSSEYMRYSFDNAKSVSLNVIGRLRTELNDEKTASTKANALRNKAVAKIISEFDAMSGNIETCRREAWGASTNTSDVRGCVAAAIAAMKGGQEAVVQAKGIREGLSGLIVPTQ